jgi:hypothetical protein
MGTTCSQKEKKTSMLWKASDVPSMKQPPPTGPLTAVKMARE